MTLLDRYVALAAEKSSLDGQLTAVKDELALVEQQLLDEFTREGVTSKRHAATGKLVHVTRRIWARANGDRTATAEAISRAGGEISSFAHLDFNVNSLSAYFREQAREREATGDPVTDLATLVPAVLREHIALTEDHRLSVRS